MRLSREALQAASLAILSAWSLRRSSLWALTLTILTVRSNTSITYAIVIQIGKLESFSLFLTESYINSWSLTIPSIVAALSVKIVTLAFTGLTIRVVRQANILALVNEGHNMADAAKFNVLLFALI